PGQPLYRREHPALAFVLRNAVHVAAHCAAAPFRAPRTRDAPCDNAANSRDNLAPNRVSFAAVLRNIQHDDGATAALALAVAPPDTQYARSPSVSFLFAGPA
ncbi:MAG: hypothetical protein AAB217_23525, partial [Chloroflexota bacterium]